ncbi:MAG: hypothetical protein D4R44_08115 [Actinobacteria bacterium]|nr:MAG: hypothetical protein D4R44_08115 [Actinomycetota bacterium]
MTAVLEKTIVRLATTDDDLSSLLGVFTGRLNPSQVLVVDTHARIDGMLILWDGGHQQIRVDHLQVHPDAPCSTGAKLIEALYVYCRERQISEIMFCTASTKFAVQAHERGGIVSSPMFYVTFPVPKESLCPL